TLAQDLRTKGVDGSDGGFFEALQGVFQVLALAVVGGVVAGAVQFLAESDFEFAGGFMREGYGGDVFDSSGTRGEDSDDSGYQFGCFAGSGGGFDEEAFAEGGVDAGPGGLVVSGRVELRDHVSPASESAR